MRPGQGPFIVIAGTAVLAAVALALVLALSLMRPTLGLHLEAVAGQVAVTDMHRQSPAAGRIPPKSQLIALTGADGARIELEPGDLIEEPDMIPSYDGLNRFRDRQDRLAAALASGEVTLEHAQGDGPVNSLTITPLDGRPLTSLPLVFWVQVLVGLAGLLVGAWVRAMPPARPDKGFLMLAGAGLCLSAMTAAVYSTRALALPGDQLWWLALLNHIGTMTFGIGMIGLFLIYPRRIAPRRLIPALTGLIVLWTAADLAQVLGEPTFGKQLSIVTLMLLIVVAVVLQYRATRGDLAERAVLRWFGLSVTIGAGGFVLTVIAPLLLGLPAVLSQGYAFLFFLVIYAGLALAIQRYRIFELEDWAFRVLFYMAGLALLIGLDATLIYAVALDRAPAFGVSLLVVAAAYLPLRDTLARRILSRHIPVSTLGLVGPVSEIALARSRAEQDRRWDALLARIYQPLEMAAAEGTAPATATIGDEGVTLRLPAVGPLAARVLRWGHGGRHLFSAGDRQHAADLCAMLAQMYEGRAAYDSGASEERARIARDIHDNIGMHLMGALHSGDAARKDTLIRETLSDLREIIASTDSPGLGLGETLADLRLEMAEHLEAAGLALHWLPAAPPEGQSPARTVHAVRAILREAVGNVIAHAGATEVRIDVAFDDEAIHLSVEDDGQGAGAATPPGRNHGHGMRNMRARADALGGSFETGPARNAKPGRPGHRIAAMIPYGTDETPDPVRPRTAANGALRT